MNKQRKQIKGYKGFNKDFTCKGFQFEEGKTYKIDEAKVCKTGFHLCLNPLDCLSYYDLCDSEFAEVEALGKIDKNNENSKISTTEIKIGAKLSFKAFVETSVNFMLSVCKSKRKSASGDYSQLAASGHSSKLAASGDSSKLAASGHSSQLAASGHSSQLAASGDSSQLAASGDYSKLAASGDYSKLEINGQDSVGAAIGINNKIKGKKGNWITLAEWIHDNRKNRYIPFCVKSVQIDGEKIKADTWYQLVNGEIVEAKWTLPTFS